MMRKFPLAAAAALTLAAGGLVSPAFAQIPVTVTSDVPGTTFHIENIAKYVAMIEQMKSQVAQLQQTYKSMTGSSGIGQLFQDPQLAKMLPSDWQNVYNSVKNGGYSGISGSVSSILSGEDQAVNGQSVAQAEQALVQRQHEKAAYDKAMGEQAYQGTIQRLNDIQGLVSKIDTSTDPKEIMDLQARIQGEQAAIQNEQTKLQLMAMLQRSESGVIDAQKTALEQRILSTNASQIPSIGN
jgi:type IV secretion system protein VirB5